MKNNCQHCGLENKNQQDKFCCNGCAAAYQIINDLGLENYYQSRLLNNDVKSLKPEENIQVDISEFATQIDNNQGEKNFELNLMVEGLHCGACIWLIENVLRKQACVLKARINMSSKKLCLQWRGNKEDGNNLVKLVLNLGYRLIPFDAEFLKSEEQKYNSSILKALAVAGFAAGNIMLTSVALWANNSLQMGIATRNLLYWVSALIALPAIVYSGRIFVISALKSIKAKRTNMDVPIAVAIILASIISIFEAITKGEHAYFDSVIMLIFFLLIGRYLDFSARRKAFSITGDLIMLSGVSATIIEDKKHRVIASKNLQKDMILNVAMGEKIAADGIIIDGEAEIDTSVITGEAMPKKFIIGDEVFAGMINLGNALQVKITKAKQETLLAKIVQMVENIETGKNYYTQISDIVAKYYTPIVHIVALITFLIWCFIFHIGWHQALLNAAAVLIITCPCALALAIPVVQIVAASRLLKQGILIKNGQSLEKINKIDTIVFDKTGTLTIGKPTLFSRHCEEHSDMAIQLAASMAAKSKHPLSKALAKNFQGELLDLEVKEVAGMGLVASYNGEEIRLGNQNWIAALPIAPRNDDVDNSGAKLSISSLRGEAAAIQNVENLPLIYFKYKNKITTFIFKDQLKEDAKEVIKHLNYHLRPKGLRTFLESRYNETDMVDLRESQRSLLNINGVGSEKTVKNCFSFHSGKRSKSTIDDYCSRDSKQVLPRNYRIILLSGDKQSVVESIAKELGIEEYYFEKTPDKKLEILQKLKSDGKNILMIGDGINDAPSLIQADVSMSPASAADISKNVADIIFQGDKLYPILETILTAKKSNQIIKQNLFFSLIYNLVAVPFAMIGYIVPFFAALAMSSSSIVVVVNALRIRKNNLFFTLKK